MDTRHPSLARSSDSVLVVVDCQERLWPVIHDREGLERRLNALIRGARLLEVPVLITEQYPKGLGRTLPGLREAAAGAPVLEKMSFSCGGDPSFVRAIQDTERGTVIVCGIEAHVCVLQTTLDLLAEGYHVQVVADGVASRNPEHRDIALRRMDRAGAVITCFESVLFECMERCDVAQFKAVQGLLK